MPKEEIRKHIDPQTANTNKGRVGNQSDADRYRNTSSNQTPQQAQNNNQSNSSNNNSNQ